MVRTHGGASGSFESKSFLDSLLDIFKKSHSSISSSFSDTFPKVGSSVSEIGDWFNGVFDNVGSAINSVKVPFWSDIQKEILSYSDELQSSLMSQIEGVVSGLSSSFDQLGLGINAANQTARQNAIDANAFAAEQAQKQMDFQERMSNTAFQRARSDAEAAGFNPILAYTAGPASTPAGSAASASQAQSFKSSDFSDAIVAIAAMVTSLSKSISSANMAGKDFFKR